MSKLQPVLDDLPLKRYPYRNGNYFSTSWLSTLSHTLINRHKSDIVHLHWIADGLLSIKSLAKINKPVVWTLHDSWAFTGGCHVPYECKRYQNFCGKCPVLGSKKNNDLSASILSRKEKVWKGLDITIITPSQWLAECASSSKLFRNKKINVIPNGIDTNRFKPMEKRVVRDFLSLPHDKHIIMTGAIGIDSDINKGFHLLKDALRLLYSQIPRETIELSIFGMSKPENPPDLGVTTHYLGRLEDEISMALIYSVADVFIIPSIQESFGLTALEALSCGVPVVGFNSCGLKDVIDHKITGYLAKPYDPDDLSRGISWVLNDNDRRLSLSQNARKKVESNFSIKSVTERYLDLYKEII